MLIVFTTVPTREEAESIAEKMIELRLAACVQILPKMTSVYRWEGNVQKDNEHLLLIKTLFEKYDKLETFILANHSYEVPEIVAIESSKVTDGYAKWLGGSLG